jgi:hypothetical protein
MNTTTHRPPVLSYYAGLDLGRAWEYSALAVLERAEPADSLGDMSRMSYAVRHLERFPPGTPYPVVFARVVELFAKPPLAQRPIVVDFTAVGRTVVEALRRVKPDAALRPATVTAGLTARPDDRGGWLVPRTELVGLMQVLLQSGRLKVADALPEADTLVSELENFKAEVPRKVEDDVAAWRERAHDDLVLATALAAWEGDRASAVYLLCSPSVIEFDGRRVWRPGLGWWTGGSRW